LEERRYSLTASFGCHLILGAIDHIDADVLRLPQDGVADHDG
jgi:hypothetical protein